MSSRLRARSRALGVALVVLALAGCGGSTPVVGVSPSVPAGLDAIPATPLPGERNGIETMPSPTVATAILAAVEAQTAVAVDGTLERTATQEDGTVERTPFAFAFAGAERAYVASATWDGASVELSRSGDDLSIAADPQHAQSMGRPDAVALCLSADDALREQWGWLDGVEAILATLLEGAQFGGASVDESGQVATFFVVAGGAVVGTLEASAVGDPVPLALEIDDPSGKATVTFDQWSAVPEPTALGCDGLDAE